jgi:hypothetical protein
MDPSTTPKTGWFRNLTHKILQITHGRSTAFFIAFFIAGHVMALLGKLTPVYVGFMGTLGGLVLGHAIQENALGQNLPPQPGGPDVDPKTQT